MVLASRSAVGDADRPEALRSGFLLLRSDYPVDGDDDDLVAVGWFDRFGIQRMAVDRALLGGKDELEGVFVTLLKGEPI
jgi:hypothetical protein